MFDDFKQEIAHAVGQVKNWYADSDNRTATWLIVVLTAVSALVVYGTLFFGGRAAFYALSGDTVITIADNNLCLTDKGLVKTYAPAACYEYKLLHDLHKTSPPEQEKTAKGKEVVYNPPCGPKSNTTVCSDQIYGKRLVEGLVSTVTFNSDEKLVNDDHLQPDYTEIKFDPEHADEEPPSNEKFCGNVLDRFTPGKKIKMVINESKLADYNGCYTIDVVTFTFGGDLYHAKRQPASSVPDARTPEQLKALDEKCRHINGGTCG